MLLEAPVKDPNNMRAAPGGRIPALFRLKLVPRARTGVMRRAAHSARNRGAGGGGAEGASVLVFCFEHFWSFASRSRALQTKRDGRTHLLPDLE
jgi:hypothetical protein